MKKFLAAIAVATLSVSSFAQPQEGGIPETGRKLNKDGWYMPQQGLNVICNDVDKAMDFLQKGQGEQVLFTGMAEVPGHGWALTVNPESGAWTILLMNPKKACVVGSGNRPNLYQPDVTKPQPGVTRTELSKDYEGDV
jgi:hypothetical protein